MLGLDTVLNVNLLGNNNVVFEINLVNDDDAFLFAVVEGKSEFGDLACARMHIRSSVQPRYVLPYSNIPESLRDKLKSEIDYFCNKVFLKKLKIRLSW